jgi:hypothetical protein
MRTGYDEIGRKSLLFLKKKKQKDFIFCGQPNHPANSETAVQAQT